MTHRATRSSFIMPARIDETRRGARGCARSLTEMGSGPVLVLLGSSRSRGNTRMLVDAAFPEACRTLVDLRARSFSDYDYEHANRDDDFADIADALITHDCIVLATPVYWYSMSATMKRFVDRLSDLVTIRKPLGRALAGRHLFVAATSTDPDLPGGFEQSFRSTAEYLDIAWGGCLHVSL
ncbi:MAG: flavodoxin family protein [Wenzhouxiangellaceae bacterium]